MMPTDTSQAAAVRELVDASSPLRSIGVQDVTVVGLR